MRRKDKRGWNSLGRERRGGAKPRLKVRRAAMEVENEGGEGKGAEKGMDGGQTRAGEGMDA